MRELLEVLVAFGSVGEEKRDWREILRVYGKGKVLVVVGILKFLR